MIKETIAVALSGGIDSMTAAYLLKKEGWRVIGIHFSTGYEKAPPGIKASSWNEIKVQRLESMLEIKVHRVDLGRLFDTLVVDYFVSAYSRGQTPNPCLVCNQAIKFGALLQWANQAGALKLATGHYARCIPGSNGRIHLLSAKDRNKDQSYFLARLKPEQLKQAVFPLGNLEKSQVVEIARSAGLKPLEKGESQDVCFIHGAKNEFIEKRPNFHPLAGPIVDLEGRIIGRHQGLHRYTVGQRKGINIPAADAYYVIKIDRSDNRLVVGKKADTFSRHCTVSGINWINKPSCRIFQSAVRIRYRHIASTATIEAEGNWAKVQFDRPQSAITPGQGAVFYRGPEVIGGGWIE